MFVRIEYQCHSADNNGGMVGEHLKKFVEKMDKSFVELMAEKGYAVETAGYNPNVGVRLLFFVKMISA